MKFITLAGKVYAINLLWQICNNTAVSRKQILKAAKNTAQDLLKHDEEYNCVALRRTSYQYGLGYTDNLPKKSYSLAAAITSPVQSTQGFLGIFPLAEGFWVYGTSQGAISARGDRFFATELEANNYLEQIKTYYGAHEQVICSSEAESEKYLLPLLMNQVKIEPLYFEPHKYRTLFYTAGCCAALLLSLGLAKYLYDTKQESLAVQTAKQILRSKAEQKQLILQSPELYFEQDWLESPLINEKIELCLDSMLNKPLSSNGWLLTSIQCQGEPAVLKQTFAHRPGASYTDLPLDSRLDSPKQVSSQKTLARLNSRQDLPLWTRTKVTAELYEITRKLGLKLKLSWANPETKTIEDVQVTAPWQQGTWIFDDLPSNHVLSGELAKLLVLPGLTLERITFEKNQWQIRGFIYANIK